MTSERLEALLWERIEGSISGEDLAELQAGLQASPEARELERQVQSMSSLLDGMEDVSSPTELRSAVREKIAKSPAAVPPGPRPGQVSTSSGSRYLYLAAGLLLGVIGYHLVTHTGSLGGSVEPSDLQGAMVSPKQPDQVQRELQVDALGGSLYFWRVHDLVLMEMRTDYQGEVTIILEGDPGGLRTRSELEPGEGGHLKAALGPFRGDMGTIQVRVEADGEAVAQETYLWHELPNGS